MGRPRRITPVARVDWTIEKALRDKLMLLLYSEVEGKVPLGAPRNWLEDRIREYLSHRALDLAPFSGIQPGTYTVHGSDEAITHLEHILKGELNDKR